MTDSAGLAGETAALDRDDDVVLGQAIDELQRLLEDHAQHGAREVDHLVTGVDRDLAGAGLDPDAGDGVLALAGGIGAALRIDLLDVDGSIRLRGLGDLAELLERLKNLGHGQTLAFLLLSAATSSASGDWAAWGCSAPL